MPRRCEAPAGYGEESLSRSSPRSPKHQPQGDQITGHRHAAALVETTAWLSLQRDGAQARLPARRKRFRQTRGRDRRCLHCPWRLFRGVDGIRLHSPPGASCGWTQGNLYPCTSYQPTVVYSYEYSYGPGSLLEVRSQSSVPQVGPDVNCPRGGGSARWGGRLAYCDLVVPQTSMRSCDDTYLGREVGCSLGLTTA